MRRIKPHSIIYCTLLIVIAIVISSAQHHHRRREVSVYSLQLTKIFFTYLYISLICIILLLFINHTQKHLFIDKVDRMSSAKPHREKVRVDTFIWILFIFFYVRYL